MKKTITSALSILFFVAVFSAQAYYDCASSHFLASQKARNLAPSANLSLASFQPMPIETLIDTAICEGKCYEAPGDSMLCEPGTYEFVLTSSAGLDSTVVINIQLLPGFLCQDPPPSGCPCTDCPLVIEDNSLVQTTKYISTSGPNDLADNPLQAVCFNISHTWVGDLSVSLTSPSGEHYLLMADTSNNFGGCGNQNDDVNICITTGTSNPLTNNTQYICNGTNACLSGNWTAACGGVTAPISGALQAPGCDLAAFNVTGQPVAGAWTLMVTDVCSSDPGILNDWSLQFAHPEWVCSPLVCEADGGNLSAPNVAACQSDAALLLSVLPQFENPSPPDTLLYGYTFFVSQNGLLTALSPQPDLKNLPAGIYEVYGFSYHLGMEDSLPALLGLPLSSVKGKLENEQVALCADFSDDFFRVEILEVAQLEMSASICQGACFLAPNGTELCNEGAHEILLPSASGCDTLLTIHLTLLPPDTTFISVEICPGNCYPAPDGSELCDTGVYPFTLVGSQGCDSILVVTISVTPPPTSDTTVYVCQGNCFEIAGQTLCNSGSYEIPLTTVAGCDSILTVHLNVLETQVNIAPPAFLDCPSPEITLDGSGSVIPAIPGGTFQLAWSGPGIVGPANQPIVQANQPGLYCLTITFALNGLICQKMACVQVQSAPPTPGLPILSGSTSVCDSSSTVYTSNVPGGGAFDYLWTTPNGEPFSINAPGTIEVDWTGSAGGQLCVTASNGCVESAATCIGIEVLEDIAISNFTSECTCDFTAFTVSFEIHGGDPASYTVAPMNGTLSGNVFTSFEIPAGSGYSFTISDGTNCSQAVVEDALLICNCTSSVGNMDGSPLEACRDTATATYLGGEEMDCDDALCFFIHTSNNVPILTSSSPTFDLSGLNPGQTYYISAAVGNDNGSGCVDFTDPCLSISNGTAVVRHELPTAFLSGGGAPICAGEPAGLTLTFTGTPPWNVEIEANGSNFSLVGIVENPFVLSVSPTETTTYNLLEVVDAHCINAGAGSAQVEVLPAPTATISGPTTACFGDSVSISVTLSGTAPFVVLLLENGFPAEIINLEAGENMLTTFISGTTEFTIVQVSDANCTASFNESLTVSVPNPPVVTTSYNAPLCAGMDLQLQATGGTSYHWTGPNNYNSEEQNPIVPDFQALMQGFYIVEASDDCDQTTTVIMDVALDCEVLTDTVFVGTTDTVCFDDLVSATACDDVSVGNVVYDFDSNCIYFEGLEEGTDTVCFFVIEGGDTLALQILVTVVQTTGTEAKISDLFIKVYPNPTTDEIWVAWKDLQIESAELFDVTGRLLKTIVLKNSPAQIGAAGLPSGTYYLRFKTPEKVFTFKWLMING